jgi:putative transposase
MLFEDLNDNEWAAVEALFCPEAVRTERRGRPRVDARPVVNAVLWMLSTGEGWSKLPGRYPSPPTCRRRFEEWQTDGTLAEALKHLSRQGREISLRGRAGTASIKPPAPPSRDRLRGAFWTNPESWRAPTSIKMA